MRRIRVLAILLTLGTILPFVPVAAGQTADLLSDPLLFDKLANPSIASEANLKSRDSEWRILDLELDILGSLFEQDPDINAEVLGRISLARSLLDRFFDFTARIDRDEPRALTLIDDRIALNLPESLPAGLRNEIASVAVGSYRRILEKWESTVDYPLPSGFLFIKIYFFHELMVSEYGLPEEARGVAFPCRYVAAALRLDSQGRLVREELENIIRHELIHVFSYMSLGFAAIRNLPTWFHEGIALELSGQARFLYVTQDAAGTHIMTIASTQEYSDYERNFRYLKEKYGNKAFLNLIRESLVRKEVAYGGLRTLSSQAEAWFGGKARFEWIAIIVVTALLAGMNLTLKRDRLFYSSGLVLGVLFVGSFTPYFRHSKGKYGFGFLVGLFLLHSAARHVRRTKSPGRALSAQLMKRAADHEESLEFEKALECYKRLAEILDDRPEEKAIALENAERMKLLLELRTLRPQ